MRLRFAGCVLVSDNQSWVGKGAHGSTRVMTEWKKFAQNQKRLGNDSSKLVCIDVQPCATSQAPERDDILNVGGFSDAVFNVVSGGLPSVSSPDRWLTPPAEIVSGLRP